MNTKWTAEATNKAGYYWAIYSKHSLPEIVYVKINNNVPEGYTYHRVALSIGGVRDAVSCYDFYLWGRKIKEPVY